MTELLTTRLFTDDDQIWFAEVSGDWNEIHVIPAAARRTPGGRTVVHGMHSVLWALDAFLSSRPVGVSDIKVTFRKPVHLEEEVAVAVLVDDDSEARLAVVKDDARLIVIRLGLTERIPSTMVDTRVPLDLPRDSAELTLDEIAGLEGELTIPATESLDSAFPAVIEAIGSPATAQLGAVSRLVGMVCPGRYSLLTKLDLTLNSAGSTHEVEWAVSKVDTRVAAVSVDLSRGQLEGLVQAFVRPRPVVQPSMSEAARVIRTGEFSGQRALIVGGSRGLGELTAKLLAAGDANVVVTWQSSEVDSQRVVEEITSADGVATSLRLDVSDPIPALQSLSSDGWLPTHVYYYATPPIFVRRTLAYDADLFNRFADVYVGGLVRLVEACRAVGTDHLTVFVPSSVAVEDSPQDLLEYASAKAASEVAARTLEAANPWLEVVIRRLPRLPTDQTASFIPVPTEDPMPVMVDVLQEMNKATGIPLSGH